MEFDQLSKYDISKINYLTNKEIEDIDISLIANNISDKSIILFGLEKDVEIPSSYQIKSSSMGNALGSLIGALVSSLFNSPVEQNRLGDFSYKNNIYEIKTYKYERAKKNKKKAVSFETTVQPSSAKGENRDSNKQYNSIDYFVFVDKVLFKDNNIVSLLFCSFNNIFPDKNNMNIYKNSDLCNIIQNCREYSLANNKIIYL